MNNVIQHNKHTSRKYPSALSDLDIGFIFQSGGQVACGAAWLIDAICEKKSV